jgi:hypothetical protein
VGPAQVHVPALRPGRQQNRSSDQPDARCPHGDSHRPGVSVRQRRRSQRVVAAASTIQVSRPLLMVRDERTWQLGGLVKSAPVPTLTATRSPNKRHRPPAQCGIDCCQRHGYGRCPAGLGAVGGHPGDLLVEVARVSASCRAQGTAATTTPCRRQVTQGASASRYSFSPAASRRHRRRPAPASKRGQRARQIPQRRRARDLGRSATTMTCVFSSNHAASGTSCSHPAKAFNTVVNRTPSSLRNRSRASTPQDPHRGRRVLRQALRTDPQMEHKSPILGRVLSKPPIDIDGQRRWSVTCKWHRVSASSSGLLTGNPPPRWGAPGESPAGSPTPQARGPAAGA